MPSSIVFVQMVDVAGRLHLAYQGSQSSGMGNVCLQEIAILASDVTRRRLNPTQTWFGYCIEPPFASQTPSSACHRECLAEKHRSSCRTAWDAREGCFIKKAIAYLPKNKLLSGRSVLDSQDNGSRFKFDSSLYERDRKANGSPVFRS